MRPHHFQPDHENGPDFRGDYRCVCGMAKPHESHQVPERTEDDISDRILGEGEPSGDQ
jgi:hypothetical protein